MRILHLRTLHIVLRRMLLYKTLRLRDLPLLCRCWYNPWRSYMPYKNWLFYQNTYRPHIPMFQYTPCYWLYLYSLWYMYPPPHQNNLFYLCCPDKFPLGTLFVM